MNREVLLERFPRMLFDKPLREYCTFNIGGGADYFYQVKDKSEVRDLVSFCKEEGVPFFILGAGSNILFDDKGFRGLVIRMENDWHEFGEDGVLKAESGTVVAALLGESLQKGWSGLERWVGLPGTIGGAVRGNAGCNGLETKDFLIRAELLNPESGEQFWVENEFFEFDYRESKVKHSGLIVLEAHFQLKKRECSAEEQKEMVKEIRKQRIAAQPFGATTGSFFKNPKEGAAGLLIEKCGIKGSVVGDAQISEKHGNFFLNLGKATAEDILALKDLAQERVYEEFGVKLEPEVFFVPEKIAV